MCGEQRPPEQIEFKEVGSPPRVRGTACAGPGLALVWRITPACAGNSGGQLSFELPNPDHPRVCGEQQHGKTEHEFHVGSPPRVRGTASDSNVIGEVFRITPACAGNRKGHP